MESIKERKKKKKMIQEIFIFFIVSGVLISIGFGIHSLLNSPSKTTQSCSKDSDCQEGQRCNAISNICVQTCTSDNDCNQQSFCHPSEKMCQIRAPCSTDDDCGSQEICDANDNRCKISNSPIDESTNAPPPSEETKENDENSNALPPSEQTKENDGKENPEKILEKKQIPGWHDQLRDDYMEGHDAPVDTFGFVETLFKNWGKWRGMATCPENQYVCGIKARNQKPGGSEDDTALNGLKIYCCDRNSKSSSLSDPITVFEPKHTSMVTYDRPFLKGKFYGPIACPLRENGRGLVTGIKGYYNKHQSSGSYDDVGMTHFEFDCQPLNKEGELDTEDTVTLDSTGSFEELNKFYTWANFEGPKFKCPKNKAVCAVDLRVEEDNYSGFELKPDATGVSWIRVNCCGVGES